MNDQPTEPKRPTFYVVINVSTGEVVYRGRSYGLCGKANAKGTVYGMGETSLQAKRHAERQAKVARATRTLTSSDNPKKEPSSMGLCPSNGISKAITGKEPFPNVAGMGRDHPQRVDGILINELESAGIGWEHADERYGEPQTLVVGNLHGWTFRRAWYYWIASGPILSNEYAMPLHESHGKSVRVSGHCGCPSPEEWCGDRGVGLYHVDNQEGLKALADTIRNAQDR